MDKTDLSPGAAAIFVKTPGLSPIKTRLAARIGVKAAENFHLRSAALIASVLGQSTLKPYWSVAETAALNREEVWPNFERISQGSGELGNRLHAVYTNLLEKHPFVILLGADSPQISLEIIETAAKSLRSHSDFVIGRAEDGGFYLFGGKKKIPEAIWTSIPYSSDSTAQALIDRLPKDRPIVELPRLIDVDTEEDLKKLPIELQNLCF